MGRFFSFAGVVTGARSIVQIPVVRRPRVRPTAEIRSVIDRLKRENRPIDGPSDGVGWADQKKIINQKKHG